MVVNTSLGEAMVNIEEISTIHPNMYGNGIVRMKDGFVLVTSHTSNELIRQIQTQSQTTPKVEKEEDDG